MLLSQLEQTKPVFISITEALKYRASHLEPECVIGLLQGHYQATYALWGQRQRVSVWIILTQAHSCQCLVCNTASRHIVKQFLEVFVLTFGNKHTSIYGKTHNIDYSEMRSHTHRRKNAQLPNTGGIKTLESCPVLLYNSDEPPNSILLKTSCSPPFFLPLSLFHTNTNTHSVFQSLSPPPPPHCNWAKDPITVSHRLPQRSESLYHWVIGVKKAREGGEGETAKGSRGWKERSSEESEDGGRGGDKRKDAGKRHHMAKRGERKWAREMESRWKGQK